MTEIRYAEPGYDPTQDDHPMPGPTLSSCLLRVGLIIALVGSGLFGVSFVANQAKAKPPTPTIAPTIEPTAYPTYTPYPTYTIPAPVTVRSDWTNTPTLYAPSQTVTMPPTATVTPTPTETPLPPGFLATWTPGPWILTRFAATHETRTPTPDRSATARPSATGTGRGAR